MITQPLPPGAPAELVCELMYIGLCKALHALPLLSIQVHRVAANSIIVIDRQLKLQDPDVKAELTQLLRLNLDPVIGQVTIRTLYPTY